jgi:hypothetical protein
MMATNTQENETKVKKMRKKRCQTKTKVMKTRMKL